jgi:hypothetical protein
LLISSFISYIVNPGWTIARTETPKGRERLSGRCGPKPRRGYRDRREAARRGLLDACAIRRRLGDAREAEIRAQLGELPAQIGGLPGRSINKRVTA